MKIKMNVVKKDYMNKISYAFRNIFFRIFECIIIFIVVSTVCLIVGSTLIPLLSYEMSAGFGLTQNTNVYIAIASWILPMLFYVLLITAAMYNILKAFIKFVHKRITATINKHIVSTKTLSEPFADNAICIKSKTK